MQGQQFETAWLRLVYQTERRHACLKGVEEADDPVFTCNDFADSLDDGIAVLSSVYFRGPGWFLDKVFC